MFHKYRVMVKILCVLFLMSVPLSGQQSYVSRYDLYTGYALLNSPKIGLVENGFHTQFGYRPKTWVSPGL